MQDITQRKIAEKEREKLTADLIQRNRDLEQFTFIISHNLRAPTANIIGFTENLLYENLTPEEYAEFLQGLSVSASGLDNIIKDMNSILQVKREMDERKQYVNFDKLIADVKVSLGDMINPEKTVIETDFTGISEFYTLKVFLYSIFYNLISNSVKYREISRKTVIKVSSSMEGNKVFLKFKDNGLGINMKENGSKIFGLYSRFHTHIEGKGLGLFMVKTQVEAIGGKISVKSEVNEGTEFTIEFDKYIPD